MDTAEMLASVGTPLSLSISEETLALVRDEVEAVLASSSPNYNNSNRSWVKGELNVSGNSVQYVTINIWNS